MPKSATGQAKAGTRIDTNSVTKRGNYYFNQVDDKSLLVGFGTRVPSEFRSAPFFLGVAHTGYHFFLGLTAKSSKPTPPAASTRSTTSSAIFSILSARRRPTLDADREVSLRSDRAAASVGARF